MVCGDNHLHDYSFVDSSLKSWNTTRVPLDSRYYGPREKYRAVNVIYLINHTVGLCRTLSESTSETTPVTRLSACSCCRSMSSCGVRLFVRRSERVPISRRRALVVVVTIPSGVLFSKPLPPIGGNGDKSLLIATSRLSRG